MNADIENIVKVAFLAGAALGTGAGLLLYAASDAAIKYYRIRRRYKNLHYNKYHYQSGNALNNN